MSLPDLPLPQGVKDNYLASHDLKYHFISAGQHGKPLVLFLHGFPELAFTWRKVLPEIADQGYFAVAFDQRGYGRTTGWDTREYSSVDLNTFTFTRLVRDVVIFVNALGYSEVSCLVGHDFGAVIAAMTAMVRPDMFKSLITMSHPFRGTPRLPFNTFLNPAKGAAAGPDFISALKQLPQPRKMYKWYCASEGAAEEMENPKDELHQFFRGYFHTKSADWDGNNPHPLKGWTAEELAKMPYYYVMPLEAGMRQSVNLLMAKEDLGVVSQAGSRWLPDDDLNVYVQEFGRTGFQGSLNWYRVSTNLQSMIDLDVFAGKKIDVPWIFISGEKDWGTYQEPGAVENLGNVSTQFKGVELVDGAGHWVQQEQPEKVIKLVLKFLGEVKV